MSFLCNCIVDGVAYAFSPYLEPLSDQFDAPKGKVAWIPSLLAGVYLSVGGCWVTAGAMGGDLLV